MATAQFPTTVWDGNSPSRDNQGDVKAPDAADWQQLIAELQATQQQIRIDEASANLLLDAIALTLANGWANKTNFGAAKYRRAGKWVYLQGAITAGTKTSGTVLFTLPSGSRPLTKITFPVCPSGSDTGDANMRIQIDENGDAKAYGLSSTISIDLTSITFSIDQ